MQEEETQNEGGDERGRGMREKSTLGNWSKYAWLLPFISGICWGGTGIFVRTLEGAGMENFTIICIRMLAAAAITAIWILLYDRSLFWIERKDIWAFLVSGMVGMTMVGVFYNVAVAESSLALAAVLLAMSPVFVILLAAILFHERITGRKMFCVALALLGCVLVSGVLESGGFSCSARGILGGILACFFYALYGIVSKGVTEKGYHFLTITFYGTLFSGISMLPFSRFSTVGIAVRENGKSIWIILLVHAFVSSVLPYALYALAMRYMEAGKAAILASSEPAAAMLFGAAVYGEMPSVLAVMGLVCTILAVILLNREPVK